MVYVLGVGEIPISLSGDPAEPDRIVHTVRGVGPVSRAITRLKRSNALGIRGPFGKSWPVEEAAGRDVLVIAGGIGLAPLRPVVHHLLAHRQLFGRVALLYGARTPADLLYRRQLDRWRRLPELQVRVTVDRAEADWEGDVGVVGKLIEKVRFDPHETLAMICGPEVMIRFTALALKDHGIDPDRVFVSLERNMKCAIGHCGHCQFGPAFVCKDGPVFRYASVETMMAIREL